MKKWCREKYGFKHVFVQHSSGIVVVKIVVVKKKSLLKSSLLKFTLVNFTAGALSVISLT